MRTKGPHDQGLLVAHRELIPKGVKVPNTLLSRLGRPATQGGRNGPSQNTPKGPHPPCPHCGKTNHKPDDCFTKYPEKAEAYKASRKTQKKGRGQRVKGRPLFTVRRPIRVNYESAWEHAYVQQIELLGQELEVLHEPRPGLSVKHKRGIILQARYLLQQFLGLQPYHLLGSHSLHPRG